MNLKLENCVIKEIGRLREISFRHVGEGSGKKRDIDSYDFYYKHLIIWDDEALGNCRGIPYWDCAVRYSMILILRDFIQIHCLTFDEKFEPYLERGLELGRSFVQPKYWNQRALDYLWQGIGAYVKNASRYTVLFGAVSLSDTFNQKAKG